jgi:hypothetical protein
MDLGWGAFSLHIFNPSSLNVRMVIMVVASVRSKEIYPWGETTERASS